MAEDSRILIVDDDPGILNALKRELRGSGYDMDFVETAKEGLVCLEERPYSIVISDYKMTDMLGTDFIIEVRSRYPEIVRIMMSGFADMAFITKAVNQGEIYRFIPKPWNRGDFRDILNQASEQYRMCEGCLKRAPNLQ